MTDESATAVAYRRPVLLDCLTYATLMVEGNGLEKFITSQKTLTTRQLKFLVHMRKEGIAI